MTTPGNGSQSAVNTPLTLNRPRRPVENDDYAAFVGRVLRAYSRRIAAGDIEAIAPMTALSDQIDTAIHDAITSLRDFGYSWADIARPLGVTRQAAQQRWGHASTRSA